MTDGVAVWNEKTLFWDVADEDSKKVDNKTFSEFQENFFFNDEDIHQKRGCDQHLKSRKQSQIVLFTAAHWT